MKRIGLLDVDGHNYPNLALMKISMYHKQKGDIVEWYNHIDSRYDKVYASKVFTCCPITMVAKTSAAEELHRRFPIVRNGLSGLKMLVSTKYHSIFFKQRLFQFGLAQIIEPLMGMMHQGNCHIGACRSCYLLNHVIRKEMNALIILIPQRKQS